MFSKACEYAIKAMIFIEHESQRQSYVRLNDIAEAIDSPVAFTAKILQKLRKSGLLLSSAGAKGGFQHAVNSSLICLRDIIVAIDGAGIFKNCMLGLPQCSNTHPCPVHDEYARIRSEMEATMKDTLLKDLADKLLDKKITLK